MQRRPLLDKSRVYTYGWNSFQDNSLQYLVKLSVKAVDK